MDESRSARLVVRLFPASWRARYGEEFVALLSQTGVSVGVAFDVLLAALDAHMHPTKPPRRWPLMIQQLRRRELVVFAAWVVFGVVVFSFGWMTKDEPFVYLRASQPLVGLAFDAVSLGAVLSAIGLAVAGFPIALAIAVDALRRGHPSQLVLLAMPVIAVALWLGLTLLLAALAGPVTTKPASLVFVVVWVASFFAAVVVGAVGLGVAALNADIDAALYRRAVWPARITVAGMLVAALAVIGWGAVVVASDASLFWGAYGMFSTSLALDWLVFVVVAVAATLVALRTALGLRRETA